MARFPNGYNLLVIIFVALGSTACSYGLSIVGSTLGQPSFYRSMNLAPPGEPGYGHTANMYSLMNGLSSLCSALGAAFNSWTADKFSRKYSIQFASVIFIIGAALSAGSVNFGMFVAARCIIGWGIGMLISVIPMFQSEIATPEARGFMVSMHGVMFAIGYPLAAWVGTGVYFISASGSASTFPWRFPLALPIVFAVVLLIGSPWLPFSPRWLMSQGRYEEAEATLERLHGTKGSDEHRLDEAKKEFLQIRSQMALDQEIVQTGFFELVRTPSNRKRVLVSVLLMAGNMFTGILMLSNYGIVIFSSLGMTGAQPIILLAGVTSLGLPGNLLSAFIVDQVGRRRLLLIGISGILVSLICECTMYALYSGTTNRGGNIAGVFFLFMLVGFWGSCCDATQYLYLSEIWPNHLRSQGVAVGMFTYFCTLIIILVAAPIGLDHIGWEFFLVLIVPEAFYLVAIYFLFPETMGRSLEDINGQFGDSVAVRYYGATEADEKVYSEAIETEHTEKVAPSQGPKSV